MIDLAWISLAALVVVIALSCTTSVNPGFLSLALAWFIGIYIAPIWGQSFKTSDILAGFPVDLFLTLAGVTLLFSLARANGTLDHLVRIALQVCRGNAGWVPIVFFGLAAGIASIGAGNIATAALLGPLAMAVAERTKVPPLLLTIMVAHGCIAGALSPIAPTGIIANNLMARLGMSGFERQNYLYNLTANFLVAAMGFLTLGGVRLLSQPPSDDAAQTSPVDRTSALAARHWVTLGMITTLVVGVIFFKVHIGLGAIATAAALTLLRATDDKPVIPGLPWSVMMMVCGVTVLTSVLEKTGGIDLFTTILARCATRRTVTGVVALVTGLISVYSSTSGVVLPAFLPSVPGLVAKLGGGDPVAVASSVLIGGHLVDVSPLSTIGALCIAAAPATADRRLLFNQLLVWGLSMSVVGAALCYLAFGSW
jgi:di/tricarboxylate transporter